MGGLEAKLAAEYRPKPQELRAEAFYAEHDLGLGAGAPGEPLALETGVAFGRALPAGRRVHFVQVGLVPGKLPAAPPRPRELVVVANWVDDGADDGLARFGRFAAALERILDALGPSDRVALITGGGQHGLHVEPLTASSARGRWKRPDMFISPYELEKRVTIGKEHFSKRPGVERRMLVITNVVPASMPARVLARRLGEAAEGGGFALSIVGVGARMDARVVETVTNLPGGTYSDVPTLARFEAIAPATLLEPVARALTLEVRPAPGYRVVDAFGPAELVGFARYEKTRDSGSYALELSALLAPERPAPLVLRLEEENLLARWAPFLLGERPAQAIASARLSYTDARGQSHRAEASVSTPPYRIWGEEAGSFAPAGMQKSFALTNMAMAMRAAMEDEGRCGALLDAASGQIEAARGALKDPELARDLRLIERLRAHCRPD